MIQKKICMVGSFAVGKTSLVRRYVDSIFSDKYHTTVGVKIDKKDVVLNHQTIRLMIWDLAGDDHYQQIRMSHMRGAVGYVLVADGTRAKTLDIALELSKRIEDSLGNLPFILVLNKNDLVEEWEINKAAIDSLKKKGLNVIEASAKNGSEVERVFEHLAARQLLHDAC